MAKSKAPKVEKEKAVKVPREAKALSEGAQAHEDERLKADLAAPGTLENIYYSFLLLEVVVAQIAKYAPKSILLQKVVAKLKDLVAELKGLIDK